MAKQELITAEVFKYLDSLASEGAEIPSIKEIRAVVGGGMGAVCSAVKAWKEQNASAEEKRIREAGDKILSDTFTTAVEALRLAVVNDVEAVRQRLEKDDAARRAEYERKESELLDQLEKAATQLNNLLVEKGRLEVQLEHETASKKEAQKERTLAVEARDKAEAERDRDRKKYLDEVTFLRAEKDRLADQVEQLVQQNKELMAEIKKHKKA